MSSTDIPYIHTSYWVRLAAENKAKKQASILAGDAQQKQASLDAAFKSLLGPIKEFNTETALLAVAIGIAVIIILIALVYLGKKLV